jgi:two-component system chemotaxis response regulator CheY
MNLSDIHFHLVDDNDIDTSVNMKLLQLGNISNRITTYSSAIKFLEHLKEHPEVFAQGRHIVLLDIMMPVMDGFDCLAELEKLDPALIQNIDVFMLSSSIDRNNISKAEKFQIVKRVIEKPLDVYLLKMALEDLFAE